MYHRHWEQHDLYPAQPRHTPPPWPSYPTQQPLPQSTPHPYTHDHLTSRLSLAGSLDPATGIFYRSPEHPRLRTAQACEKCRTRKAKCSGEHPTCKRCSTRGLVCEYAKEGRVRGPNKPKVKTQSQSDHSKDVESTILKEEPSTEIPALLLSSASAPQQPRRHSETRAVRPRPSHLRLEATHTFRGPTPHHTGAFVNLFPTSDAYGGGGDSGESSTGASPHFGRRSCSLSESGGSVPASAVSSTFDLSLSQSQHPYSSQENLNIASSFPGAPAGMRIHPLTHEQQQQLLEPLQRHQQLDLELDPLHGHHQQRRPIQQHHPHQLLDTPHQLQPLDLDLEPQAFARAHEQGLVFMRDRDGRSFPEKYSTYGLMRPQQQSLPQLEHHQPLPHHHHHQPQQAPHYLDGPNLVPALTSPIDDTTANAASYAPWPVHYAYDHAESGQPYHQAYDNSDDGGGDSLGGDVLDVSIGLGGGHGHTHGHGNGNGQSGTYNVSDTGEFCG
ncbi:hypothetical protein C0991_007908 [Blastosporella zonata]|nr:hypothetical protein C0991_007908 [Blastosporella zonata]